MTTPTVKSLKALVFALVLTTVFLSLILYGWFEWSNLSTRAAIGRVLKEDSALSASVLQNANWLDKNWDGSGLVLTLVARMDQIDLSGCPTDFQHAYKCHVAAWGNLARVKRSNEGLNGCVKAFLTAGLSAIPAMNDMDTSSKEIQTTWQEVQRISIDHGVTPR